MSRVYLETEHQELFIPDAALRGPMPVHIPSALGALGYYVCLRVPAADADRLGGVSLRLQVAGLRPDDVSLTAGEGLGQTPDRYPSSDGMIWRLVARAKVSRGDGVLTLAGLPAGLDRAVVLGAGGAARGVVHGLLSRGIGRVDVINRTRERTADLARDFAPAVVGHDWSDTGQVLDGARLLVNTTSLGMTGKPPLEIDLAPLPGGAVVNDIVYVPMETGLLAGARSLGLRTVDGLGMLLHQAVPCFEQWYGVRPQVTEQLRSIVIADIEAG
jgi:hypothetical protein